jgi:hypothetical protein
LGSGEDVDRRDPEKAWAIDSRRGGYKKKGQAKPVCLTIPRKASHCPVDHRIGEQKALRMRFLIFL